jgi:hypothetical protein
MGLYDNPVGALDPRSMALMQAGLGMMSGPSMTPVSLGQQLGRAGQIGMNAFQQTQQANQQNQLFAMKMAEVKRQEDERVKKEAAMAQLLKDPRFANMGPLLQVAPQQAIERAFPKDNKPVVVAPGSSLVDPEKPTSPLYTAPAKPDAPGESDLAKALREMTALPPDSPNRKFYEAKIAKLTSHAPAPSARAEVKTGDSLAKEIGPMLKESRDEALASADIVNTTHRIGAALETGQVNLGPGATIKTKVEQVSSLLGVGGGDVQTRLVNTRNVIRGLAQLTVANRKALKGQGSVTDNEQKLLERAEAGNIDDFTIEELKDFMNVSERLARTRYSLHGLNMKNAMANPGTKGLASFFRVPDLPAPRGQASNPAIQSLLDKYAPVKSDE